MVTILMAGKLNSLTDVLKKTLFFFEALSVGELAPHVHRKMLKDYTLQQVEEKVNLCLEQNECFYKEKDYWHLNLEGNSDNDPFYAVLLKKGEPQSIKDISKNINAKKKKVKKLFSEEAMLISDGRFIQMDNGLWGLTEWEVETSHYSLKNLVIKAMKIHPGGLSAQQLYQLLNTWRETDYKTMENILNKFPYFEMVGEGIWSYNPNVRVVYETIQKKFVSLIEKQKSRWHRDRNNWKNKFVLLQKKLEESMAGQREVAAALAEKIELNSQQDYLLSQMAEKDLLLSLRKKEIFRYREHLNKLESKANSILHQCRLWVKRTRDAQAEIDRLKDLLAKNQSGMEGLFSKLQQYKEKDRVNKMTIAEIKEQYSTKIAALQREIVELKQKNERLREMSAIEEYNLKEQINSLSSDLKKSLRMEEEQQRSLRQAQQELSAVKEAYIKLESRLNNPLIKLIIKICALIEGKHAKTTL
jgi:hypothetical protein